jgi:nitrate reductase NapE component
MNWVRGHREWIEFIIVTVVLLLAMVVAIQGA